MNGSLMDVLEAAEYLQISKETLYRMIKRREIPYFRLSQRIYRFSKEELNIYLKSKGGLNGKEKSKNK
jgi:excisionase family DNA binding protein